MHAPVEICFHNMIRSTELIKDIEENATNLDQIFDQIRRCQVIVEAPNRNEPTADLFKIRIQIAVPNRMLVVDSHEDDEYSHDNPFVAIQKTFDAMRGKLEAYLQELASPSERHSVAPHGRITKICLSDGPEHPECGHGIISTCDGREVYFHADCLKDVTFQHLELGSEVDFTPEDSDEGLHAASVRVVGQQALIASV